MARTARTPSRRDEIRTEGMGSEPDPDGGDVGMVVKKRRTTETEVAVEKIFGVDDEAAFAEEKESEAAFAEEKESDTVLDIEKDVVMDLSKLNGEQGNEKSQLKEDEDSDDLSDEDDVNHNYQVGDFVWGKIRSHPWWPGQIYDPSDASEYAVKLKQKNRLLVAYFGDDSFSWCHHSQLKPFVENFEQMSKQSSLKNFVYAVECALDEISRVVELESRKMYTQEKDQMEFPKQENAGIKAEASVPRGSIGKLLVSQYGPVKLLAIAKNIACENSFDSLLEFSVLKSWISSIYYARGGHKLCTYSPPIRIEGLLDLSKDGNSLEGELIDKPADTLPEVSADKLYKRRKPKSIVEHMKEDLDLYATSASTAKKRGRKKALKGVSEKADFEKEEQKVNADKLEVDLTVYSVTSTAKKRGRKKVVGEVTEKAESRKKKKKVDADEAEVDLALTSLSNDDDEKEDDDEKSKVETEKSSLSREKKRSRYLSPPYLDLKKGTKSSNSKNDSETNSDKIPDIGVRMAKAASLLIGGSPVLSKCNTGQKSSSKLLEEPGTGKGSQKRKKDKKANISLLEIGSIPNEILYEVRSVAIDPISLIAAKNLETMAGFFSAYRNCVFANGSNHEIYSKGGKKRKSISNSESEHVEVENGSKKNIANEAADNALTGSTEVSSGGTKSDLKKDLPALIVTFPPGFSLPSRDDIIKRFSSFGDLDEEETDVFYNSFCARLVYRNSSDAEEAFNISIRENPFGTANVNFRLRYPSSAQKDPKLPFSMEQNISISESGEVGSKLGYVKNKLEEIMKMVDDSGEEISEELQANLESGLKNLLEKVSGILR